MQRANDVLRAATAVQHDRLAMAADVRQELHPLFGTNQYAPFAFGGERVIISGLGYHQLMADITRTPLEQRVDFAPEKRFVEVGVNRKLCA